MRTCVIRPNIDKSKRILVTSDVHGHLEYLKGALKNAGYSDDDVLIIVGDIIERGPSSLETLRYIMELEKRGNVYVLMGNVDLRSLELITDRSSEGAQRLFDIILLNRSYERKCMYEQMACELGIFICNADDVLASKDRVLSFFREEIDYLMSRPTVLEADRFVFVHGGLRHANMALNECEDVIRLLKYDRFFNEDVSFEKYVVVGHWPVTIYNDVIANAEPITDDKKKIISIDGGCGLKTDGQLNMMEIPSIECADTSLIKNYRYDEFLTYEALDDCKGSDISINIHWGDTDIRVIERGEEFSLVEHISSGYVLRMYNKYIYGNSDITTCNDYTDRVLDVKAGDMLSLVHKTSEGYIVKKDGQSGWYYGRLK